MFVSKDIIYTCDDTWILNSLNCTKSGSGFSSYEFVKVINDPGCGTSGYKLYTGTYSPSGNGGDYNTFSTCIPNTLPGFVNAHSFNAPNFQCNPSSYQLTASLYYNAANPANNPLRIFLCVPNSYPGFYTVESSTPCNLDY